MESLCQAAPARQCEGYCFVGAPDGGGGGDGWSGMPHLSAKPSGSLRQSSRRSSFVGGAGVSFCMALSRFDPRPRVGATCTILS
jgi:hypothetical protein